MSLTGKKKMHVQSECTWDHGEIPKKKGPNPARQNINDQLNQPRHDRECSKSQVS
jgi:hypothetical protein